MDNPPRFDESVKNIYNLVKGKIIVQYGNRDNIQISDNYIIYGNVVGQFSTEHFLVFKYLKSNIPVFIQARITEKHFTSNFSYVDFYRFTNYEPPLREKLRTLFGEVKGSFDIDISFEEFLSSCEFDLIIAYCLLRRLFEFIEVNSKL